MATAGQDKALRYWLAPPVWRQTRVVLAAAALLKGGCLTLESAWHTRRVVLFSGSIAFYDLRYHCSRQTEGRRAPVHSSARAD